MKRFKFAFFILVCLTCIISCKKNNTPVSATISTWTFKGVIDTGMAVSVINNTSFKYAINGQQKSITLNFLSAIRQSTIYSVAKTLNDSTECTIKINDANGQFYYSSGKLSDQVKGTLLNHTVTFDFKNITLNAGSDTQFVSGKLSFPSFY